MAIESTFTNSSFEKAVIEANRQNPKEIFPFEYENEKYWVKKARATESRYIHKLFYKLFSFEVLLPVEEKNAIDSLTFEVNKINKLRENGIKTPEIPFCNEEFFVLTDGGKMINSYIRKRDITKDRMYYFIELILVELSKIHNINEFHGGAQARNFTFKEDEVFVIDLEDSFDKSIDVNILQFRDLILLLMSLTKTRASFDVDYEYVINRYMELCPQNSDFKVRLCQLAQQISFLIGISQIGFINKLIGRDGQGFFKLFSILLTLNKDGSK